MEEQNKKIFSTVLMVVGALFIIISGGIFVSQSWQYLSPLVKKLLLAMVTVGFFGASVYMGRKTALTKAPAVFYYLGVCFVGLTTMMVMGDAPGLCLRMASACMMMLIPVVLHFFRERSFFDLILQILLADGMVFCATQFTFLDGDHAAAVGMGSVTLLLSVAVYYSREKLFDEKIFERISKIAYGIHFAVMVPFVFVIALEECSFFFGVLPFWMLMASLVILRRTEDHKVLRVIESIAFTVCNLVTVNCLVERVVVGWIPDTDGLTFFLTMVINLVVMAVMDRRELVTISSVCIAMNSLLLLGNGASMDCRFIEIYPYYPTEICFGAALLLRAYLRSKAGKEEWSLRKNVVISALWTGIGVNALLAFLHADYCSDFAIPFAISFLLALGARTITDNSTVRRLLDTCSMVVFLMTLAFNDVLNHCIVGADGTVIADFTVEYYVAIAAIGIVLLGLIWYDVFEGIRTVQFVISCCLIVVLVLSNLDTPSLPNVLFLGISMLIMLLLAVCFKKKNYTMASAVTLILVALYLTKEVWMSIAWWVYLFVAGVGLILFAIKKEKSEK